MIRQFYIRFIEVKYFKVPFRLSTLDEALKLPLKKNPNYKLLNFERKLVKNQIIPLMDSTNAFQYALEELFFIIYFQTIWGIHEEDLFFISNILFRLKRAFGADQHLDA